MALKLATDKQIKERIRRSDTRLEKLALIGIRPVEVIPVIPEDIFPNPYFLAVVRHYNQNFMSKSELGRLPSVGDELNEKDYRPDRDLVLISSDS